MGLIELCDDFFGRGSFGRGYCVSLIFGLPDIGLERDDDLA